MPPARHREHRSNPARALSGVVLAGGQSRRMGHDKARVEVEGEPLVLRVARRVRSVADDVCVASGDGHRLDDLRLADHGFPQVADAIPGVGPIGGVVAGLEQATHPLVAVVACDLPDANPAVLAALARHWDGTAAAVVPVVADHAQPLHAVWAAAAAPRLRALAAAGEYGVIAALASLGADWAGPEVWGAADPERRFTRNVDRPEDVPPG